MPVASGHVLSRCGRAGQAQFHASVWRNGARKEETHEEERPSAPTFRFRTLPPLRFASPRLPRPPQSRTRTLPITTPHMPAMQLRAQRPNWGLLGVRGQRRLAGPAHLECALWLGTRGRPIPMNAGSLARTLTCDTVVEWGKERVSVQGVQGGQILERIATNTAIGSTVPPNTPTSKSPATPRQTGTVPAPIASIPHPQHDRPRSWSPCGLYRCLQGGLTHMARPRSKVPRRRHLLFQAQLEEFHTPKKSQNVDPCPPGRRPCVCEFGRQKVRC